MRVARRASSKNIARKSGSFANCGCIRLIATSFAKPAAPSIRPMWTVAIPPEASSPWTVYRPTFQAAWSSTGMHVHRYHEARREAFFWLRLWCSAAVAAGAFAHEQLGAIGIAGARDVCGVETISCVGIFEARGATGARRLVVAQTIAALILHFARGRRARARAHHEIGANVCGGI